MRTILITLLTLVRVMSGATSLAAGFEPAGEPLRPGIFLVSSPGLIDPNFLHTVVLLVSYSPEGAVGLIINRPTEIPVEKALPKVDGIEKLSMPVYFGGPVGTEMLRVLLRSDAPLAGAQKVLDDVYVTASRTLLTDVLREQDPGRKVRIYAGYAGWAPSQLDREFARGDWISMDADRDSVFLDDPSEIWSSFIENRGKIEIRLPESDRGHMVSPGTLEQ